MEFPLGRNWGGSVALPMEEKMTENVRLIVKFRINYIYSTEGVKRVQQ